MILVGAEADDERIELILSEVKGKDITELCAAGRKKLASVPSGGGSAAAAAAPAESKEEKKEEEVSDDVSKHSYLSFFNRWDFHDLHLPECKFFANFSLLQDM